MDTLLDILGLVVGIIVLAKSADVFVDGAASLARRCGLSPLLVGMIVVGFGTSFPEMTVSVIAAAKGSPEIALGNVYGSNIANICLILGLTALLSPIAVTKGMLKREIPVLIVICLLCGWLISDKDITRLDAGLMLLIFLGFLINNIIAEKRHAKESAANEEEEQKELSSLRKSLLQIIFGLGFLIGSSQLLVDCAVDLAILLGIPELVVGLTVVAIGTSLPELASSIAAIRKHEHDLALGNIVGSNFFNALIVVGLAGIVRPMSFVGKPGTNPISDVFYRDFPVMMAVTFLLMLFCIPWKRGSQAIINRAEGALLLLVYVAYTALLVSSSLK